ncbi:MAG: biotin transporter BioY [Hespellia sp.]|nr:biotin transporter BioY [Hespellia sp.]
MGNDTDVTANKIHKRTAELTLIGLMTAVICVLGPFSIPIPFSPVPISLTNFAIYITVYVLGTRRGVISYLLYLLIGFVGLPVFSAFTSGPAKLLGPTGGYLIGFIFMTLISGFFIERWQAKAVPSLIGMVLGTMICYLFGTLWLAYQAGLSFYTALCAGVLPFILGDLLKILLSMMIGPQLQKRLNQVGVR